MAIAKMGVDEARRNLPALLDEASKGKPSIVTKHGKIYAAIVPPEYLSRQGQGPDIRSLRGSGKGLWGRSPTATIRKLRDEWA